MLIIVCISHQGAPRVPPQQAEKADATRTTSRGTNPIDIPTIPTDSAILRRTFEHLNTSHRGRFVAHARERRQGFDIPP